LAEDDADAELREREILRLLESVKGEYSGVARRGIEALALKVKGYSGAEIAELYGVKQNLVGAWISRASAKLRRDRRFLAWLGRDDLPRAG
jgi:DNA-directed RNA polymerase specialized sigma24 family protein